MVSNIRKLSWASYKIWRHKTPGLNWDLVIGCVFCKDAGKIDNYYDCSKCIIPKFICNKNNKGLVQYSIIYNDKKAYKLLMLCALSGTIFGRVIKPLKKRVRNYLHSKSDMSMIRSLMDD